MFCKGSLCGLEDFAGRCFRWFDDCIWGMADSCNYSIVFGGKGLQLDTVF